MKNKYCSLPKNLIITLFVIATSAILNGCKKTKTDEGEGLPPLTFEGKKTFGCKINSIPWIPRGTFYPSGFTYPVSGGYYLIFNSPLINIWMHTSDSRGYIDLFIKNNNSYNYLQPGKYLCNKKTSSLPPGYGEQHTYGMYYVNGKEYITDSLHTGVIEILKSDSVNKIISGRFEFDGYNADDGKTYHITDGRFDYKNY